MEGKGRPRKNEHSLMNEMIEKIAFKIREQDKKTNCRKANKDEWFRLMSPNKTCLFKRGSNMEKTAGR